MPADLPATDLTALTTLGLLSERPRHPYELQRLIRDRRKTYVRGLPRSLYHAVDRLTKRELIEPAETTREGRRPERTLFRITGHGREELELWLTDLLATPHRESADAYPAALSLMPYLDAADALAALRRRIHHLDTELAGDTARMHGLTPVLPRLFMVEEELRLAMIQAERDYTRRLADDLASGALAWDRDHLRALAGPDADDIDLLRQIAAGRASDTA